MAVLITPIRQAAGDAVDALSEIGRLLGKRSQYRRKVGNSRGSLKWADYKSYWDRFQTAIGHVVKEIRNPGPGDGLAALWLRVARRKNQFVLETAMACGDHMQGLVDQKNEDLYWLATEAPNIGSRLIGIADQRAPYPHDVDPGDAALTKFSKLLDEIKAWWDLLPEIPPNLESRRDPHASERRKRELALQPIEVRAGLLILEAVNAGLMADDSLFDARIVQFIAESDSVSPSRILRGLVGSWLPHRSPHYGGGGAPHKWQCAGIAEQETKCDVIGLRYYYCLAALSGLFDDRATLADSIEDDAAYSTVLKLLEQVDFAERQAQDARQQIAFGRAQPPIEDFHETYEEFDGKRWLVQSAAMLKQAFEDAGAQRLKHVYNEYGDGHGFVSWTRRRFELWRAEGGAEEVGTNNVTTIEFARALAEELLRDERPSPPVIEETGSKAFERLLSLSRTADARLGESGLSLELLTTDELNAERDRNPNGALKELVTVSFTWPGSRRTYTFRICAGTAGANAGTRWESRPNVDLVRKARHELVFLAQHAGAHLPKLIADHLPGQPESALGRWLSLLFWTSSAGQNCKEQHLWGRQLQRRIFSCRPLRDTASLIESCRLASDDPIAPQFLLDMCELRGEFSHDMSLDGALTVHRRSSNLAEDATQQCDSLSCKALERATPPLDCNSSNWLKASDQRMRKEASVVSLRVLRNDKGAMKNVDGTFGVDKSGRRWRKVDQQSKSVFYWRPSLKSDLAIG